MAMPHFPAPAMQELLRRALYVWGKWRMAQLVLGFCFITALLLGFALTLAGWLDMEPERQGGFVAAEFLIIFIAYTALFFQIHLVTALAYTTLMAAAVWWGRGLAYGSAWRLCFVTGMVPLTVILLFGQLVQLPVVTGLLLFIIHALWLRKLPLPRAD